MYEETPVPERELPPYRPPIATLDPYLWQWGDIRLRPQAGYQFSYGDGVLRRPGREVTTGLHSFDAGAEVSFREGWAVSYRPRYSFYTHPDLQDHFTHQAALSGRFQAGKWGMALSQTYFESISPTLEVGGQAERQAFNTSLTAAYPITEVVSLQLGASQNFLFSKRLNNSRQWSTMNWVDWHLRHRMNVGLGVGLGYVDQDLGSDMTYQHLMGRIGWNPIDRVRLHADVGLEMRQFLDSDVGLRASPLYGAGVTYSPAERTTLALNARRGISVSLLGDRLTESTITTATIRQLITDRIAISLSGGYRVMEFRSTLTEAGVVRKDDYYLVRPAVNYRFTDRANLALFYEYIHNESTQREFGATGNVVGISIRYSF
jgi:predicted porin